MMYLLVERPKGYAPFAPVRLSAATGPEAQEESWRRFENAVGYDLAMLYELGDDGVMRLVGRFERGVETVLEGEVLEEVLV